MQRKQRARAARCAARIGGRRLASLAGVALSGVALAACGSSGKGKAATSVSTSSRAGVIATTVHPQNSDRTSGLHQAAFHIRTPALLGSGALDPRYTCHGEGSSPPMRWLPIKEVMPEAREQLLFIRTIAHRTVTVDWAIAGLSPTVHSIEAGKTPAGAIVGRNGYGKIGYTMCPPKEAFITFAVYGMPRMLGLHAGWDPNKVRRLLETSEVQWGGLTMVAYPPSSPSR